MLKPYYLLAKPGIIRGNAITATAGFFLASKGNIDFSLYIAMLGGLSLTIASACVFNNYIDRDIDSKMARTKKRALVSGTISVTSALIYALILGIIGAALLALFINLITLAIALIGLFFYVVAYGYFKRHSVYGTLVGSISGAVPPVVGYTSVSGSIDLAAAILFLILVMWQMPHFFAIAIYRFKDYRTAGIPVLPVKKGLLNTKINMFVYIVAFIFTCLALGIFGYTGFTYLLVVLALGFFWLRLGLQGFGAADDRAWAKKMFKSSLLVITLLSLTISLDAWLP
ncbi:protoheme IX farnesyltransferase [Candidatus Saccharibacteria bacterium]|nr:protoheme IX farnesyltransferase [Candidatus Saccharibacteria bacterium]